MQKAKCAWELATWMGGTPSYAQSPSAEKRNSAMTALAQLHHAAASFPLPPTMVSVGPSPGLIERVKNIRRLQDGELTALNERIRADASIQRVAEVAREILSLLHKRISAVNQRLDQVAETPMPLGWCLRDIHAGNLLFEGDHLSGLVDYGAVAVDSVAIDLARLIRSLAESDTRNWQDCLQIYLDARPLTRQEIDSIGAFDQAGIIIASANWLRWIFVEGQNLPDSQQVVERLRLLARRLRALDSSSGLAS